MHRRLLFVVSIVALLSACETAPPGGGYVGSFDAAGAGQDASGGGAQDTAGGGGGAQDTAGGGGGTDTAGGGGGKPVAQIDPACIDGTMTSEAPPTAGTSIADLVAAYNADDAYGFVLDVLDRRYPTGSFLVEQSVAKASQNCFDLFLPQQLRGNAAMVLDRLEVIVHECGHLYDWAMSDFGSSYYHIADGVTRSCPGAKHQGANKTVARSLLNNDAYSALRPPCKSGKKGTHGCDSYADIYLDGDPTDAKFESGDQGFATLHEETVQYVHSLAVKMGMADKILGKTSARDGILTFLWYTMRYLHMVRLEYPDSYSVIASNACWREAVLLTWGRAWHLIEASKGNGGLGIDDAKLFELVAEPALLDEIARLRAAHGCGG